MMHTILQISQVLMAYLTKYSTFFELAKSPYISRNLNKTVDTKIGRNFTISDVFEYFTFGQVVLQYIHQENV